MKKALRLLCVVLSILVITVSFVGCHKKDEIAVTVNGIELRSATYMCALIQADLSARDLVYNELSSKAGFNSNTVIDYFSQKIEGTDYVTWVKTEALKICKEYVAAILKCRELGITLSEEDVSTAENYALYNWNYYGYGAIYEANGVSYNSYLEYVKNSYLKNQYFLSIYGKDGTSPANTADVEKVLYDNYDIMNYIIVDFADSNGKDRSEDTLKAEKKLLENIVLKINDGTLTFADAKKKYETETTIKDTTSSTTTSSGSTSSAISSGDLSSTLGSDTTSSGEPELKPLDPDAVLIGSEDADSNYVSDYFKTVHALKEGQATIVEEDERYLLLVRGNIKADPYYLENLYDSALAIHKFDDFEKDFKAYAHALELTENKFATDYFKVKNINYLDQA